MDFIVQRNNVWCKVCKKTVHSLTEHMEDHYKWPGHVRQFVLIINQQKEKDII